MYRRGCLEPRVKCLVPVQSSTGGERSLAARPPDGGYYIHEGVPPRVGFAVWPSSEMIREEKKQLVAAVAVQHGPVAGETRAWHAVPLDVQIRKRNPDEK